MLVYCSYGGGWILSNPEEDRTKMAILDYAVRRMGFPGYIEFAHCPGYYSMDILSSGDLDVILCAGSCFYAAPLYQAYSDSESQAIGLRSHA